MPYTKFIFIFLLSIHNAIFAASGDTMRISIGDDAPLGILDSQANANSSWPAISSDGRYIAFISSATNFLTTGTTTNHIFIRDNTTERTFLISKTPSGIEGNAGSLSPSISADGRYVAFTSNASNLVPGDSNNVADIFVHDRDTNTTRRVSVDSAGNESNGISYFTDISADGQYVVFHSGASNLVSADTNNASDVFLHNRDSGTTNRISINTAGIEGNSHSDTPSISADGNHIAFISRSTNLDPLDPTFNALTGHDIYLHNRVTGQTTLVSVNTAGAKGNNRSYWPSISGDGRYITFYSSSTNLVTNDTNGLRDIFLRDIQTGLTSRISISTLGIESMGGDSYEPAISANGRYIAFRSKATNLVSNDTNNTDDVFIHNQELNQTTRVSIDSLGAEAIVSGFGPGSFEAAISDNGVFIAFSSIATNLVSNDTNNFRDVFVHERPLYGDADGNGIIDTNDIIFIINMLLNAANNPITPGPDCNNDGNIDVADIVCTIGFILNP